MGYQTAQALALMDKMNLEQQIKNHLLGNFYPRHDVRLVPIAVEALEIYRDNINEIEYGFFDVWDTYIELPEEIEFRNSNKISVGQCIESLRLDAWIDIFYSEFLSEEDGDWLVPILSGVEIENEKDALAFVIADNRLVELGGWNRAELLEAIEKIEHEFDVEEIGFQDKEVDLLIEDVEGTVSIEDIIDEKALQENNIYFDIMFEEEYHQELFYKFLDVLRDTEEGFTISERLYNHINKVI